MSCHVIDSSRKYLLTTSCVPDTVLGNGGVVIDMEPTSHRIYASSKSLPGRTGRREKGGKMCILGWKPDVKVTFLCRDLCLNPMDLNILHPQLHKLFQLSGCPYTMNLEILLWVWYRKETERRLTLRIPWHRKRKYSVSCINTYMHSLPPLLPPCLSPLLIFFLGVWQT